MKTERVFVYGTLRPPQPGTDPDDSRYYPRVAAYVQSVAPARLSGAVLYDLGAYPAARPGEGVIHGELLTIAPAALQIMDQIEGHPRFFYREQVSVQSKEHTLTAWIYWAPEPLVAGRGRIPGGDWFRRSETPALPPQPAPAAPPDPVLQTLVQRLAAAPRLWLVSVRPDGRPRARVVPHIWHQGRVYALQTPLSAQLEDILQNPGVSLIHPDPAHPLTLDGWATPARALYPRLLPLFRRKHPANRLPPPDAATLIEITPLHLRARGEHAHGDWDGRHVVAITIE